MEQADFVINGQMFSPGVYMWVRGAEILYIGQTSNLMQRIGRHSVINQLDDVQHEDEFKIWYCDTPKTAKVLEKTLLAKHPTKYNCFGSSAQAEARTLRVQMVALHEDGVAYRQLAKLFSCCQSTVSDVIHGNGQNLLSRGPYNTKHSGARTRRKRKIEAENRIRGLNP